MNTTHKPRDERNEKDTTGLIRRLPRACTDEALAVEFMEQQRWGEHPACPHCGALDVYQMRDRATGQRSKRWLWLCRACGQQFTVRVGTVFEDSRIPLQHWCFAFWRACAGKKGVSALEIHRTTQVSYKSALFMMHRIRYAMATDSPTAPKLTGTIEADETYVGGKPRPRGERGRPRADGLPTIRSAPANKVPVMAMVQRDGEVRAEVLTEVTARNVSAVLLANVSPEAHLRTDEGSHYIRIGRRFASHEAVTHSAYEFVRGDASTNAAESFFSRLKRQLYGTHHVVSGTCTATSGRLPSSTIPGSWTTASACVRRFGRQTASGSCTVSQVGGPSLGRRPRQKGGEGWPRQRRPH